MAIDSPDSRRKHPHSPSDDESQDRSKRHKHRHHHRRRHRHHTSRSKDHEDDRKGGVDAVNGEENFGLAVEQAKGSSHSDKIKADSDMEEGEILEDNEISGGGSELGVLKAMSDSESGEIRALGAPTASNTEVMDHDGTFHLNDGQLLVNSTGKPKGEPKSQENNASDEGGYESNKVDKGEATLHRRSHSPAEEKNKRKGLRGVEVAMLDRCSRLSQSPSHGRYRDEGSHRSRSKSPSYTWRKSHSQSIVADEYLRHGHNHVSHDYDRGEYVLDDDRNTPLDRDNRHQGKDLMKHRDKERRHVEEYKHHDYKLWDRESKEKYRDRKMEKETKIKDKDHEEERQHHERDRYPDSSRVREAKKERENYCKGEKRRERSRDGINEGEYDQVIYREKDSRDSKTRDLQEELRRGSSRSSYIDRDRDVERERDDRVRHRDRLRDASERQRDDGSDRHRNKDRDVKSDRVSRHRGRDDEDRYGDHGRSYDSKHRVNASGDYYRNGRRMRDSEKDRSFTDDLLKESVDNVKRDKDDQDEYPEDMELDVKEQEEEDINRIKEESRKRSEAIYQKYRTQELQKKVETQSHTSAKEPKNEPPGLLLAAHTLQGRPDDKVDQAFPLGKSPSQNEASTFEKGSGTRALGEGTPKSERSNDMFSDDIFGGSQDEVRKTDKGDGLLVERSGLHDNWDDPEGYYGHRLGEILDGRYEIIAAHGKGVFSTVIRAKDLKSGNGDPEEVAIKIIRSNDTMLKAGMEELVILKKLVGADPDDRRHCVRYISSFKYRNHLCLVFESLHMNLREVLKKFGRNIGLKLTAVRAYSKQLFIALKHLKNCGVLHCDIKPDNMLVNDAKNVLKLCDFGNAMFAGKNEVTPYLVSRFYRAPEIILGLAYDHPLDMWSVGCCMYELYTGKVLFPGSTNNDMLRLHMELKGPFPKKMLRKGAFTVQNFDHDLNFLAIEEDVVTKKSVRRLIVNIKPKDVGTIMKGSPGEDPKMLANFKDLLDKIFVLDPDKRLTVSQALSHPFITGK